MTIKSTLYLIVFLYCTVAEASSTLDKCKANIAPSILSSLSDIPFSGRLALSPHEIVLPVILTTYENSHYALEVSWSDIFSFHNKITSNFASSSPFSYSSDAPANILLRGYEYKRPDPGDMKSMLDEFVISAKLQIARGSLWEACFTTFTIGENILSGRAFGETYLLEREYFQSIISFLFLTASLMPRLKLFRPLAQSSAVSVFSSFIVRRVAKANQVAVFSFSDGVLSYAIVLPLLLASKYSSPINENSILRWTLLMMPYLLEQAIQAFTSQNR